jgi:hypothetical protein
MFEALINECRESFAELGWRKSLFRGRARDLKRAFKAEKLNEQYWEKYLVLCEQGRVVWSTYVQANMGMFAAGNEDLPGNTLFGVDPYFY